MRNLVPQPNINPINGWIKLTYQVSQLRSPPGSSPWEQGQGTSTVAEGEMFPELHL